MARSFNQLTLVGYLRRDPESTMTPTDEKTRGRGMSRQRRSGLPLNVRQNRRGRHAVSRDGELRLH